ncbi:cobalamin receptor [Burkholderia pseudomallei MSHR6137]|nr:cobalamin receptor [Burkholderia pseudomallei MSHR6137]
MRSPASRRPFPCAALPSCFAPSARLIASSPRRHVAAPHRAFEHAASSSLYARLFLQTISDAGRDGLSPLTGT